MFMKLMHFIQHIEFPLYYKVCDLLKYLDGAEISGVYFVLAHCGHGERNDNQWNGTASQRIVTWQNHVISGPQIPDDVPFASWLYLIMSARYQKVAMIVSLWTLLPSPWSVQCACWRCVTLMSSAAVGTSSVKRVSNAFREMANLALCVTSLISLPSCTRS